MVDGSKESPEFIDKDVVEVAQALLRLCSKKDIVVAICMVIKDQTEQTHCATVTNIATKQGLLDLLASVPEAMDGNEIHIDLSKINLVQ